MADMEPDDAVISAGTDFDCLKIDFSTWLCFKVWQKKDIFRQIFRTSRTLTKKARNSIKERKRTRSRTHQSYKYCQSWSQKNSVAKRVSRKWLQKSFD